MVISDFHGLVNALARNQGFSLCDELAKLIEIDVAT